MDIQTPNTQSQDQDTKQAQPKKRSPWRYIGLAVLALFIVLLAAIIMKSAQDKAADEATNGTVDIRKITPGKLVIGLEYAFPGTEKTFSELGIPGIKFYPENYYAWGEMQKDAKAPINFSKLDDMVKRYQNAGMTEITVGLRYDAKWAAKDGGKIFNRENGLPKDEFVDEYEAWLRAFVERYDKDGKDDMVGLRAPIKRYEVGVEYSTYVPEPSDQYVKHLERTYKIAHQAYPDVKVSHAAILATNVFSANPGTSEYKAAFDTKPPKGGSNKKYNDIVAILDRPDIFDEFNVHALEDPSEMDDLFTWARYEMNKRGYDKPIIVSDTIPSMFIGWGRADTCTGPLQGTLLYPALANDRCRLADYFKKLINNDQSSVAFVRAFNAEDIAKKVVIAAAQGAEVINTAYSEDIEILKGLTGAGSGNAGWAGVVDVNRNVFTNERTVKSKYPAFYALQQTARQLTAYDSVKRIDVSNDKVRLYEIKTGDKAMWVAWFDPKVIYLPNEPTPSFEIKLPNVSGPLKAEKLITKIGQTTPTSENISSEKVILTPTPIFLTK